MGMISDNQQCINGLRPLPPAPLCGICYLGSKLDVFGVQTGRFWDHLGSKLGSLGFKLRVLEAILAPSWGSVGPRGDQFGPSEAKMAKVGPKLESSWPKLGPSWGQ
eukprot:7901440-Karenia_brevis.AAC.1